MPNEALLDFTICVCVCLMDCQVVNTGVWEDVWELGCVPTNLIAVYQHGPLKC